MPSARKTGYVLLAEALLDKFSLLLRVSVKKEPKQPSRKGDEVVGSRDLDRKGTAGDLSTPATKEDLQVSKRSVQKGVKAGKGSTAGISKRGERGAGKVIILDDSSDLEGSVVSVARGARPNIRSESPIEQFGSVESDEDVVVHVTDVRPSISGMGSKDKKALQVSSSDDSMILASNSESEESKEASVAVDSPSPKKRRAAGDDNMSPSKIHVQDLTLSPRKAAGVGFRDSELPTRRASGRKKLSARAKEAVSAEPSLVSKLDAALQDSGDVVDAEGQFLSSYGCSKGKKHVSALAPSKATGSVDETGDVSTGDGYKSDVTMRSESPAIPRTPCTSSRLLGNRSLTDTDEELPSPQTMLAQALKLTPDVTLSGGKKDQKRKEPADSKTHSGKASRIQEVRPSSRRKNAKASSTESPASRSVISESPAVADTGSSGTATGSEGCYTVASGGLLGGC
ncbi:hypothetical protein VNI00_017103 [Paramarasmius palmivorus]|uniref:Uncharacterized protein n=1 Tax=Paramarasmius palmivorus TaxID=297713 RepID=A0AAW0B7P7_9AGAR